MDTSDGVISNLAEFEVWVQSVTEVIVKAAICLKWKFEVQSINYRKSNSLV